MSRTIIIVTTCGRPNLTQTCLNHLIERTPRSERDIVVVDNGSRDKTPDFLQAIYRKGDIFRFLQNKCDTVPQWQKCYAIQEAVHLTRMEHFDYFAWIDNDIEVRKGWLHAAREILKARPDIQVCSVHDDDEQDANHPTVVRTKIAGYDVKMRETANGALWVMRREFFDMHGLPPVGQGIRGEGAEDWYYSAYFKERGVPFVVLSGYSIHHGRQRSAKKVALKKVKKK